MRNILTYEFLIRLHKDTIWDKRLFFLNSHVHTIRGKIKYQARRIQRVCVRRGPGVFTVTKMPVGEGAIHRGNTPRSISTQARPAPLHIKNIGHCTHTRCIHHTRHQSDTAGVYGVVHCVLEKGQMFVTNLLVYGNAKQEPAEFIIFTPHVKLQIDLSCEWHA